MASQRVLTESDFNHEVIRRKIDNAFFENEWVTLYYNELIPETEDCDFEIYQRQQTYIISSELIVNSLHSFDEDITINERSALYGDNKYEPYSKKGIEPLVTILSFDEANPRKSQIRIHEDLIYLFNLYEDIASDNSRNYYIYKSGVEDLILTIRPNEVKIKHKYLVSFLSAKQMNFVCIVKSEINFPASLIENYPFEYKWTDQTGITEYPDTNSIYNSSMIINFGEFQNWFYAKRIIRYKDYGTYNSVFDEKYESFIVGYNKDTCSPELLYCNDEKNKYKRIYFDKEIIDQYRNEPTASIQPLSISTNFFCLKCDNDNLNYVSVYLKDLASLPYSVQLLWRKYNISPSNLGYSRLFKTCMIDGNWGGHATSPDFHFRTVFNLLQQKWENKFGWKLFKPTTNLQQGIINRLVILGGDNSDNFIKLIEQFNLLLSESIDVKELNSVNISYPDNSKSIQRLKIFLSHNGYNTTKFISFLDNLNILRSKYSLAHRNSHKKDNKLNSAITYIGLNTDSNNYKDSSIRLFTLACEAFEELTNLFN